MTVSGDNYKATTAVILAAGRGSRMKSQYPKAMQLLGGEALLAHLLRTASQIFDRIVVVSGPDMPQIAQISAPYPVVIQPQAHGTADAARAAQAYFGDGDVAILYADAPLISLETLKRLLATKEADQAGLALLTMRPKDPASYGRVIVKDGIVEKIVEFKDATPQERATDLCNAGALCGGGQDVARWLNQVDNNNAQNEYYLTDVVELARLEDKKVVAVEAREAEVGGINSRKELAFAEKELQHRLRLEAMAKGVSFIDPDTVYLRCDTQLAPDVIVEPHVIFGEKVRIGPHCHIRAFSYLQDCHIEEGAQIGPFARIRPFTHIGSHSKIGNFVEVKNSRLDENVKASHLSYLGDVTCARNANIGAGTVFCNYDGHSKHQSHVGENVFIGSNSSLVSPVTISSGATIAAGSTITDNVPQNMLAFGRARQVNKEKKDT